MYSMPENKSNRILLVQKHIIQQTYNVFKDGCGNGLESVAYWYGQASLDETKDAVLTVAVPDARRYATQYEVPERATTKMGKMMIKKSLVCLAQIHTHPGRYTMHSDYDDSHAISIRDGFLSLVVPDYGCRQDLNLSGVSVHEAWGRHWRLLTKVAKRRRICIVEDVVDLRTGV